MIERFASSDYDAGIVFADGYSSVSSENKEKFKGSRKRLFTVYFSEFGRIQSDLDELSDGK